MGRAPCCDKANVKRGPWSPEEDAALRSYLEAHGSAGNWIALPKKAGLRRCGKSCRLRWLNYLRPDIKHGGFTEEEDNIIVGLFSEIGSRWSVIASQLPGRTDNDVKNYWNTKLKKKLLSGKISLPAPNIVGATRSNSSLGPNNGFVPAAQSYSYQGFPSTPEAKVEPMMLSMLHYMNVPCMPSLSPHSPGPEIGSSSVIDVRANSSSRNSPNSSLGAVNNGQTTVLLPVNGAGGVAEGGETNFGFGFPWDVLINELLFDEKAGEISASNNALAGANPQLLNYQGSINFTY